MEEIINNSEDSEFSDDRNDISSENISKPISVKSEIDDEETESNIQHTNERKQEKSSLIFCFINSELICSAVPRT